MIMKVRNLFKTLLVIGVIVCCFSCQDSNITQSYMDDYLYTSAKFKGEDIWHTYDKIDLQTTDSIKIIRYKEAEKWIKKFQNIDSFK